MAKANRRSASRTGNAQYRGNRRARGIGGGSSMPGRATRMSRVKTGAAQLTSSAKATGRRLERSVTSAVEDNPLIVGASLFVSGAAIGYAMRGVLRDSLWLEEQRDAVVDKAKELARTASDKVGSLRHRTGASEQTEAY
jgi:hypothetical protein